MIEGVLFLGAVIAGITQFLKLLIPAVNGAWVIATAVGVGIVVALVDVQIGVVDISIAQGILTALGAAGVIATAEKVG